MNRNASTIAKLPQFREIKKQAQAAYSGVAQGRQNRLRLAKAANLIDKARRILKKVDVRTLSDPSGRRIKFPRVDDDIAALRQFAIHLANVQENAVNRPEASAIYAKERERWSKVPAPEEDVMVHCELLAWLLHCLVEIQVKVESQRASSLPEEGEDHFIDAAIRKVGLDGNNDSELARLRRLDRPDKDDKRKFSADVKAVARRRTEVLKKTDKYRENFRQDARDTLNGLLRSAVKGRQDAEMARKALASLETIPAEVEAALIKQWLTARSFTGSDDGFFDVNDLMERLLQAGR